jgi:hypothetical protein
MLKNLTNLSERYCLLDSQSFGAEPLRQSQWWLVGEEEKQPADILTEEAVEENVTNHVPILNHVSVYQHTIDDNTQEWMNQDKEQQLTDKIL